MRFVADTIWTYIHDMPPVGIAVKKIKEATSYLVDGYYHSAAFKNGYWDGRHNFITKDRSTKLYRFPTGLLNTVCSALDSISYNYQVEDNRNFEPVEPNYTLLDDRGEPNVILSSGKWSYQGDALDAALAKGRGVIVFPTGGGKCLGKDTDVLLYDGRVKKVQDVVPGDLLMGPDNSPRKVTSTSRGFGPLYRVVPVKGPSWMCNDEHVLTLVRTQTGKPYEVKQVGQIVDISVKDYLKKSQDFKNLHKLFRVSCEWSKKELPVDPYFVGLWLGDGTHAWACGHLPTVAIHNEDPEILTVCEEEAVKWGCRVHKEIYGERCPTYRLTTPRGQPNPLLTALRKLSKEKDFLRQYQTSSREDRLQFLAGMIDADGYVTQGSIEISQKHRKYADVICFIARSLGFAVTERVIEVDTLFYHRLRISGDMSCIPTKIPRKKTLVRNQKKNVLRTGMSLAPIGEGDYFGFTLDGDGRFLLGDFTVTHNTELAAAILSSIGKRSAFLTHRRNLAYQTQERLSRRLGVRVGIAGDGFMDLQEITVVMVQTASTCSPTNKPELYKFLTSCEVLIGDEIHHAESAETWWDQIVQIPAPWRFGLSATPSFTGPGLALLGLMGDVVYKVSLLELIERRVLVIPRIWFLGITEPQLSKKLAWPQAYKQGVVYSKERNEKITQVARTFQYESKSCITLVKRIGHGDLLTDQFHRAKVRTEFIRGEVPQSQRDDIFGRLKDGSLHNVVAIDSIVGEGTDLPWLQALINATGSRGGGNKAKGETGRSTLQFLGRVIRSYPGKNYADYVDVADFSHPNLKSASHDRASTLFSEGYGPFLKWWSEYRLDD